MRIIRKFVLAVAKDQWVTFISIVSNSGWELKFKRKSRTTQSHRPGNSSSVNFAKTHSLTRSSTGVRDGISFRTTDLAMVNLTS